jgi:hypothetical protein
VRPAADAAPGDFTRLSVLSLDAGAIDERLVVLPRWRTRRTWRIGGRWSHALLAIELAALAHAAAAIEDPPRTWTFAFVALASIAVWATLGAPTGTLLGQLRGRETIAIRDGALMRTTRWTRLRQPLDGLGHVRIEIPTFGSPYVTIHPVTHGLVGMLRSLAVGRWAGLDLTEAMRLRDRLARTVEPGTSPRPPAPAPPLDAPTLTARLPWSHWWAITLVAPYGFLAALVLGLPPDNRLVLGPDATWDRPLDPRVLVLVVVLHVLVEVWRGDLRRVLLDPRGLRVETRFVRLDVPLAAVEGFGVHARRYDPWFRSAQHGRVWESTYPFGPLERTLRSWRVVALIAGVPIELALDRGHREETARRLADDLNATLAALRGDPAD